VLSVSAVVLFIVISCGARVLTITSLLTVFPPAVTVTVYVPGWKLESDLNVAVVFASSITAFTFVSVVPFSNVTAASAGRALANLTVISLALVASALVIAPSI